MHVDNPKLIEYAALVMQWNAVYNLTAAKDQTEFMQLHILDSLLSGPFLHGDNILDVGSGAGLPGIPLAIMYPEKQFTLLESRGKRARFLQLAVTTLKLHNVIIICQRVETYQAGAIYTTIISRAFSSMQQMLQMSGHLCHPNGLFLAMKGFCREEELAAIAQDFKVHIKQRYEIPGVNRTRHIIGVIHKESEAWQK